MATLQLSPAHILLGTLPETASQFRTRFLISFLFVSFCTALVLTEDLDLIRAKNRVSMTKLKAKLRRCRRTKDFELI